MFIKVKGVVAENISHAICRYKIYDLYLYTVCIMFFATAPFTLINILLFLLKIRK